MRIQKLCLDQVKFCHLEPYLSNFIYLVIGVGNKLVDYFLWEEQKELIHRSVGSSCILKI